MSLEKLEKLFNTLSTCEAWSIQLLKINKSKSKGTIYMCREITLTPSGKLNDFVEDIVNEYVKENGHLDKFTDVRDYDGSTLSHTIYKLSTTNKLIATEYKSLLKDIAQPYTEIKPQELKFQAYLLNGSINWDGESCSVKLISMQNPITSLKHKFSESNGTFKEISNKVLSLKTTLDVIILDNCVYMLTMAGERLFNMERSYKAVCAAKISDIQKCNIVTDFEKFGSVAASGHNPRRFVSFRDDYLEELEKSDNRKKIAKKFNIDLIGNKFDTSKDQTVEKLVKILCNKAMVDPFDESPMEVVGSKKWL